MDIKDLVDIAQDIGEGAYQDVVDWSTQVLYNTEVTKWLVLFLCFFSVFSMVVLFLYFRFRFRRLERVINELGEHVKW